MKLAKRVAVISAVVVTIGAVALAVGILNSPALDWHEHREKLKRAPVPADVIGTWQYASDSTAQTITVDIGADGTFHQSISSVGPPTADNAAPIAQDGNWDLNSGYIYFHGLLMKEGAKWTPDPHLDFLEVVESRQRPGQAAIFGGVVPDPDVWHECTKIR